MKGIQGLWAVVVLLVLTGCAATGVKFSDAKSAIPSVSSGKGRIYFYRANSIIGAAVQPEIKLGQSVVGKSVPGGFFFVDRNPGRYDVATATETENKVSVALAAGETKYVRTSVSMGFMVGRVKPELVLPEHAQQEIVNLAYTGTELPAAASGQKAVSNSSQEKNANATAPADSASASEGDEEVVIQTVEFRPGVSSATVERLAKRFGCEGDKGAGLLTDKGPVEVYRMRCNNGTTFMAQCELRQCRPMR